MEPTRRTVSIVGVAVILAVSVPLFAPPVVSFGAVLLFGWLIAQQLVTVHTFQRSVSATTVTVEPSVSTATAGTEVPVTIRVERPSTAARTKTIVTIPLPPAATSLPEDERTLTLDVGSTHATTVIPMSVPTAGRMQIPEPRWELRDAHGLFTESFSRGPSPTVTVDAETPEAIHVGRGGSELSAYGQHPADGTGDGLTPAELREYIGGDPADRIDWKATARLPDTYVREFDPESDREISLVFDHRSQTGTGNGTPQLAYLREVALGIVNNAESVGDPLGFVAVGDDGLTTTIPPSSRQVSYTRIRERLLEAQPTPAGEPTSTVELTHPEASRQLARQLANDETRFGTILRTFADTTTAYIERIEADPLYGAIEYLTSTTANQLTIILTTDRDRTELRETIKAATSGETAVLVFLTPQVLFDNTELTDIEAAYRRYRDFETFRQDLERHNGVVAYEVGPRERLATLLSVGQDGSVTQQAVQRGSHE